MNYNDTLETKATGQVAGEKSLASAPTRKKIGFISAITIVMGSSIGAGIFFKSSTVLNFSGSNLYWAILCWVLAGFAVICMALALIEIASARNDNLGMIGWCKTFNGKYIYKGCKYFMTFIYLPLTFFFMPVYVVLSLQDALTGFGVNNNFNTANDWAIWMVICVVISGYFMVVCGLSSRATNIQNWVITSLKFVPLIVVAILGFVLAAMPITEANGQIIGGVNNTGNTHWFDDTKTNLFEISPAFGIFGGIAAIFFAFDGFYVTAGLQTEMREPKKTPKSIFIGLVLVTAIYLIIAVSMTLGSPGGNFFSFQEWLEAKNVKWLFGVVNILIAIGVLGIINGFAGWSSRFIEDLIKEGELVVPRKSLFLLNKPKPVLGTIYTLVISVPVMILFSMIGGLGYFPGIYAEKGVSFYDGPGFNSQAKLLSFADLMATWTSLFAFAFIVLAILGGLFNRKTNRVNTVRNKYFVSTGWISVVIVSLSLLLSVAQPFVNIGLVMVNDANNIEELVGNILLCAILVIFSLICFLPVCFEEKIATYRLRKLENVRKAVFARDEIIQAGKDKILSKDLVGLQQILTSKFGIEQKYANQISKLPWNLLIAGNNPELFDQKVRTPLNQQIRYTRLCIDSCHTPHWYFDKNKPKRVVA